MSDTERQNAIRSKLRKLLTLAEKSPYQGERDTARRMAEHLMTRYEIDLSEIGPEAEIHTYKIKATGIKSKLIIFACAYLGIAVYRYAMGGRLVRGGHLYKCTEAEQNIIKLMVEFHWAILEKHRKRFLKEAKMFAHGYIETMLPSPPEPDDKKRHYKNIPTIGEMDAYMKGRNLARNIGPDPHARKQIEDMRLT